MHIISVFDSLNPVIGEKKRTIGVYNFEITQCHSLNEDAL